jgi:acyl-CoA hydrolase
MPCARLHLMAICATAVFFVGASTRDLVNCGRADYVPAFLSDIPRLFRSGDQPIDVALIQVSPPDRHGNCSLGISVEATMAACEMAGTIIAQINPQMPRTHGDASIPLSKIQFVTELDSPVVAHDTKTFSAVHKRIGDGGTESRICAQLSPGAGVVTSRAQVDYVVTEYGVARLRGTSLRERAQLLIGIAHPQVRELLQTQFNRCA